MGAYYKNEDAEKKVKEMEKIVKSGKFEESYIRELVAMQKGELGISSKYYEGNIAEGNFSVVEDDKNIERFDKEDYYKLIYDEPKERIKDAEYEYVFIPSFYAVKTLIFVLSKRSRPSTKNIWLKKCSCKTYW